MERKTVTLFIYIPETKEVLLSRRGKLERHPGLWQASVHGQIEPGEIPQIALKREFKEELKGEYGWISQIKEFGDATVGTITKEHTFYMAGSMAKSRLDDLKTTQEVEKFELVSESDVSKIKKYSETKKDENFDYKSNMVMFDDELEKLKEVFRFFIH